MSGRCHRGRGRAGIALVEFALVAPLLLLLLAGVLDYGMALRTASSVAAAARAGAQYGTSDPVHISDTAGIQAAAVNAAPDVHNLSVTSATACQCPGGGVVSCTGSCSGSPMLVYVQVTAQSTAPTLFQYSGLGFTGKISIRASMRAQ